MGIFGEASPGALLPGAAGVADDLPGALAPGTLLPGGVAPGRLAAGAGVVPEVAGVLVESFAEALAVPLVASLEGVLFVWSVAVFAPTRG